MSRRRTHILGLLFLLLFTSWPAQPAHALPPFAIEFVDVQQRLTSYSSLALDARGNPFIAGRAQSGTITLARKESGVWTFEFPDLSITNATFISLALDTAGSPHVAYFDGIASTLRYGRRVGGVWSFETVDNVGQVGWWASLKLDAGSNPRIAYYDLTNANLKYAAKLSGVWTIDVVATTGTVGEYCSLALDSQGYPRISYFDGTSADLRFAFKNTGAWATELVDATGFVGQYTSLALDAQDGPRISYFDAMNGDVKYATKSSGSWQLEVVNPNAASSWTVLALDAQGVPVVAYYDGLLKYASRASGSWVSETADPEGSTGWYPSLVLDAQGNPRMAYQDIASSFTKYADAAIHVLSPRGGERWASGSSQTIRWSGAGVVDVALSEDGGAMFQTVASNQIGGSATINVPDWNSELVRVKVTRATPASSDQSPGVFSVGRGLASPWWSVDIEPIVPGTSEASLALDADDSPHIAISGKHVYRFGRTWYAEPVDFQMSYQSIQLETDGTPYIAYQHVVENALKYAYRTGGSFYPVTVANGSFRDISLALGPSGNGIAYYDVANGDLKYASGSFSYWTIETVDGTGGVNVGEWASLAIVPRGIAGYGTNTGIPVIAYYDRTNGDLKLATKGTLSWTIETVDATGNVGLTPTLALDKSGFPVIAYSDNTMGRLRIARKSPTGWSFETVASFGYARTLALDDSDNPIIAFYDSFGGVMRVARKQSGLWFYETIAPLAGTSGGTPVSMRLDAHANPRFVWYDGTRQRMLYASSALEIGEPRPDDNWMVGSSHVVTWNGTGIADLSLSVDGGMTWELVEGGVTGGSYRLLAPHQPTHFARLKIERALPRSVSITPGNFIIQSSVSLLSFAGAPSADGASLSWRTEPGPDQLAGYRLERAANGGPWNTVVPLTRETSYSDRDGHAGASYRLFAVNGLGQELLLGETSILPQRALAAWPLPMTSGSLTVSFGVAGGIAGAPGQAEVGIYDVAGRLVRVLARGTFQSGYRTVMWDRNDESGSPAPAGIYFIRSSTGGQTARIKLAVMP